jgi:DNA recombination protein RmuC
MAERYFIPGETQDTAILFVPSEAIYAELHESFEDLVQRAYRARIVLTSPNMLMLAVQTMQAILKDVKMREQAHLIQREVVHLMEDTGRLRERVLDLQRHFGQANADIEKILTSSERIGARGRKIEALEFEEAAPTPAIEQTNGTAVTPSEAPLSPTRGEGLERRRNGGARIVRQA